VIDLSSKTVLPGLIDSHVHLVSDRGGEQALLADVRDDDPLHAYEAQWNGMKTLRAGFTTVRNLGDEGATLRCARRLPAGAGPYHRRGAGISTTGGHMDGRMR
jgi:imidazolonepropionase-like amidohydrolase